MHSGYFLPRQFDAFCERAPGAVRAAFVQRLLDQQHVTRSVHGQNTQLYHVCARPLYRALHQEDNRNRRCRPAHLIRSRLMSLDVVLACPTHAYLPHGEARARYFTETHRLDLDQLPSKRYGAGRSRRPACQYFVDKFPPFVSSAPDDETQDLMSFCYVVEGAQARAGFDTHLRQYERLLTALRRFRLVYVVARGEEDDGAAERAFRRWRTRARLVDSGTADDIDALVAYFERRQWYEAGQYRRLTHDDLTALQRELRAYQGARHDALFEAWKRDGVEGLTTFGEPETTLADGPVFERHVLPYAYDLFQSVTRWRSQQARAAENQRRLAVS